MWRKNKENSTKKYYDTRKCDSARKREKGVREW
jgi:hypothetical protein